MPIIENLMKPLRSLSEVSFLRCVLTILKTTIICILFITSLCMVIVVTYFVISPGYRMRVLNVFGVPFDAVRNLEPNPTAKLSIENEEDWISVIPDHSVISNWIQNCMGIDTFDPLNEIRFAFLPPTFQQLLGPLKGWPSSIRRPTRGERALVQLSNNLAEQRVAFSSKVRSAYSFWEATALVSIVIGMVTTILVSVSSTEFGRGDGRRQRLIRGLAIIFPVLGTATAAIINFYSPQAEWGQASRTLASLTQLHDQMSLALRKLPCSSTETDENSSLTTALDDWSKRYVDIQTIASASGGQAVEDRPVEDRAVRALRLPPADRNHSP
jgi:hypothetical protein